MLRSSTKRNKKLFVSSEGKIKIKIWFLIAKEKVIYYHNNHKLKSREYKLVEMKGVINEDRIKEVIENLLNQWGIRKNSIEKI